jgi:OOP family OmpA-OmpF porin
MKVVNVVAIVAMLTAGIASAVEVKEKGAYIGGAIGVTEVDDDNLSDLVNFGFSVDKKDTGYQLWGGYKFLKWFAVEGRYSYLGEYTATEGGIGVKEDAAALTANAVFILPLGGSSWELYGQVGLGVLSYDISYLGAGAPPGEDGTETVGSAGLGVRWTPAPPVTISLGFDAWSAEIDRTEVFPIDSDDFSVGMTRLGVQYNF